MTTTLTPTDLTELNRRDLSSLDNVLDALQGTTVIVTPITAPADGALVYWNANNEGFIVQPLYTAEDRKLLARQIEAIRKEQTERKP